MSRLSVQERFEALYVPVPEAGCWIWIGGLSGNRGYGAFWNGIRNVRAHRYSLERATGKEIPPGMMACHKCDTPLCVNPDHLFVGTQSENMQDCVAKGRYVLLKLTKCINGHAYTPENTVRHARGGRECLICRQRRNRARWARYAAKKKALAAALAAHGKPNA